MIELKLKRKYNKKYYLKNKDKIEKNVKKWQENNPEKVRKYKQKWVKENIDKSRECNRNWIKNNPKKNKKRLQEWYKINTEKQRGKGLEYYLNNFEALLNYQKNLSPELQRKKNEKRILWEKKKKEYRKEYRRFYNLYCRDIITKDEFKKETKTLRDIYGIKEYRRVKRVE